VARPRAQGQAITSTETAATKDAFTSPVSRSQPASVARAITRTTGTKTPEIRSASRATGALLACARDTIRPIWARVVSAPTRVASTSSRPLVLIVAPVTVSPTSTSTGRDSPVSRDVSTAERPSTTTPSAAIFSPGRTTTRSPGRSCSAGTLVSTPSRRTTASFAPSSSSARSASPERAFARASR